MVAVGEADPATIVATLRHALDSLTQLSSERASLEEAIKVSNSALEHMTFLFFRCPRESMFRIHQCSVP